MRGPALIVTAVLMAGCGRLHPLQDGEYTFTITDVLRDDCGLAQQPAVVSKGVLATRGDEVRLRYSFLDVQLVGTYRAHEEQLTCDGTAANVSATVRGQECLLDTVAIHLEAKTVDPTRFEGSMSVTFDARQPDACVCKLWVTYDAVKTGP